MAPVAMVRARSYNPIGLKPTMERLFDGIGGLGRIVKNKTVAIKVNLTGAADQRLGEYSLGQTHWSHPALLGVLIGMMEKAGAKRVRILESVPGGVPLEAHMRRGGWDPNLFLSAAKNVELENTDGLGSSKKYSRVIVPGGGHLFKHYDLNHSYEDCDVFCSLAKMKEHSIAGVSLGMKNCVGMTPGQLHGDRKAFLHGGPNDAGYRVPRVIADLAAARPIHLTILDGIETIAGGEGPWIKGARHCSLGVLLAGTNCVNADAVAAAVMGFDPMAGRGVAPFEGCDNFLKLAEQLGVGSGDISRIEVAGYQIADARFEFRKN